ncbi:MAG: hypothetical protein RJB38_1124 [Pseudomonadota bacterium]|jgi:chemotaxis protein histidine kinase CheA
MMSQENAQESKAGTVNRQALIDDFVTELSEFARVAETTLAEIEKDMEANRHLFQIFARMMLTIRGTAQTLEFKNVVDIAVLGEEIAVKAGGADTRPKLRKCVGSLWDVITSVKYLIVHHQEETGDEQEILINRLQYTLNAFGGARPKVDQDEIEKLLREMT